MGRSDGGATETSPSLIRRETSPLTNFIRKTCLHSCSLGPLHEKINLKSSGIELGVARLRHTTGSCESRLRE